MLTKKTKICVSDHKWKTVRFMTIVAHCIVDKLGGETHCGLFAIFDGHGGKQVSEYCAERFPVEFRKEMQKQPNDLHKIITEIFAKVSVRLTVD